MKQSLKLNNGTGSLINYLMGNNQSIPTIGEGATILYYTDRSVVEVVSVSDDYKTVVIEDMKAIRTDSYGMSDCQSYKYESTGYKYTIVYRNGAWRKVCKQILYTDLALQMSYEERQLKCHLNGDRQLIDGLTFEKTTFPKINIIFGVRDAYRDYSF